MSNHSSIEHRANYHYVKIEEDYIVLCCGGKAPPHCKALILSILENWTNTKRSKGESVAIYMTYPQWEVSLYYLYARSMIILSLVELEAEKFITRQPYRTANGKETFKYTLNTTEVQQRIRALPDKSPQDTLPKLDAFKNKRVSKKTRLEVDEIPVQNYTGDASKNEPILYSSTQLQDIASQESTLPALATTPTASSHDEDAHALSSQSCSLCVSQEDIQPCQECNKLLCFEHRRDFPSAEPTRILCVECLRQYNRMMVETPSTDTELLSALGPVSGKAEPLIASTTAQPTPEPVKAARKPRAPRQPKTPLQDLDEETQARVVKVLDCLDSWRQETSGNPDQCYSREDPQAIAAIVKILPLKPSPKRLRQVCDAMWNTPRDQKTGFHWQKHMTVVNICKQYDTQSLELDAKEKKATHYTNISILPVTPVKDDDDDNLVFLGPRSQKMRKRG